MNNTLPDFEIKPPTFAFVTAFATPLFRGYAESKLGIKHVFDKPMMLEDLKRLIGECAF